MISKDEEEKQPNKGNEENDIHKPKRIPRYFQALTE